MPAGQARKNRQVTVSFAERLGALPERVAIAGVGECDVVHPETIEVLSSWRDRAADRREVVGVHREVRRAMADLTATRMRLQLAIGRSDEA